MQRPLILLALLVCALGARAEEVFVAVAANFIQPMEKIAAAFEQDSGHKTKLAFGSTGSFYAQIRSGAPYQVLLAADDKIPQRLEQEGQGVAGTRYTYAIGRLVLWSRQPGLVDAQGKVLATGKFEKLALAHPELAPYGAAAVQTLEQLGLLEQLRPRFVRGENIGQTYQFVATGNAALGFVAMSQVYADGRLREGSAWVVPENMHSPLRQDAILLQRGQGKPAAAALLQYLRGAKARAIIQSYGYSF